MTIFSHAGDLGDLIYAIPTMRHLSEGQPFDLVLYPTTGMVREPWTPSKVRNVAGLLLAQPFIRHVEYDQQPRGTVLDRWRTHPGRPHRERNLSYIVADCFQVPFWVAGEPWLSVQPQRVADIVVHRSPRYHGDFPWRELVERLAPRMVFVGSPDEHQTFTREFGYIPYHPTQTLLHLAHAIAGCDLFIGNQSTPRALAEALGRPAYVEEPKRPANTRFVRRAAWYGRSALGEVLDFVINV